MPTTIASLTCSACSRPIWSGGHAISDRECASPGDTDCRKTHDLSVAVSAVQSLTAIVLEHRDFNSLSDDTRAKVRTALTVIEELRPSSRNCPVCGATLVVRDNLVGIHYPQNVRLSKVLCPTVGDTILGGVRLPRRPQ